MTHQYSIVAHRGGKGDGFENSIDAIKKTLAHKPDMIEVDVRMTRDREFVIFHDAFLDRLTNWSGLVNTKTLKTLKEVRLKDGSRIPTIDHVFQLVKKQSTTKLILDIKDLNAGIFDYAKLIKKIQKYQLQQRVIILCINYYLLRRIASDYPELEYCYFGLLPQRKVLVRARKIGARYVGALFLTKSFIRKAHKKNMNVVSLGTDNAQRLKWYIGNKVDVISSGHPSLLRQMVEQYLVEVQQPTLMQRIGLWFLKKMGRA